MQLRILDHRFTQRSIRTRLPFKFGVQILEEVPLAELEIRVETPDGRREIGRAGDLLVPKWFEKNPDTTPSQDSAALADSVRAAAGLADQLTATAGPHPVFDITEVLRIERVGHRDHRDADVLVRGFGVAMVERALIDAACRIADVSFDRAIRSDLLGFTARRLLPEVGEWSPAMLPSRLDRLPVRHTIGMLDPLSEGEVDPNERVADGLPQTLTEDIRRYDIRRFKIKICGDRSVDEPRLRSIADIVARHVDGETVFTLDGNEQCLDLEALAGMLEDLSRDAGTGPLVQRLALLEQPLPRRDTFDPGHRSGLERLSKIAPVIIDEADTDATAFRRALDAGYAGVSVKACKGVFRAVANRGLVESVRAEGGIAFQSGEDLTNLGSIPLQQDLCLQATLGVPDVERNGHHYFRGLDHLDERVARDLVEGMPHLYTLDGDVPSLRIDRGSIDLEDIVDAPGFGGRLGSMSAPLVSE
ncbi:MAG: hypothetical protein CMJ67_03665 [Planctomycetaceae bacterium]|nr:hypothetical protein [Planctomycetaceae bacterium]